MTISCEPLRRGLSAFIDGETTPEETRAAHAHLEHCAACRRVVEDWRLIDRLLPPEMEARPATEQTIRTILTRRRARRLARVLLVAATLGSLIGGTMLINLVSHQENDRRPSSLDPTASFVPEWAAGPPAEPRTREAPAAASPRHAPARTDEGARDDEPRSELGTTPIRCATDGVPRATDVGVTERRVALATTVVMDGPSASHDRWVLTGIQAAVNQVNRSGGVCGRSLSVTTRNDSGDPVTGRRYIRSFAEGNVFALVAPSWQGLAASIEGEDVDTARIPVVGTAGTTLSEFSSPWVWAVGPSNHTFGAIAVRHAYERGARRFGIVWDTKGPWGVEAAEGTRRAISSLPGARLIADAALDPERASHTSEVQQFNEACDGACDGVLWLIRPDTAATWMRSHPQVGRIETSLSPLLLTDWFAQDCVLSLGLACNGFLAWRGLRAPIPPSNTSVDRYRAAVTEVSPNAPVLNGAMEAAYLGTYLLAEAMGRAGVDLTRDRLKTVLDTQRYASGLLAEPLSWRKGREANRSMRGYSPRFASGNFQGWRDETGWRTAR